MSTAAALLGHALVAATRLIVGARAQWHGEPPGGQRLYYANHASHLDTLVIWSALTPEQRARTRPVAARDYWSRGMRRYLAREVLDVVLIDRTREDASQDPLEPVLDALAGGESLILFPEGTRGSGHLPGQFRAGLYAIALAHPELPLVPVYLDTLHRSMPKGALIPLPLYATAHLGAPIAPLGGGENRSAFLVRAREAIVALAFPSAPGAP